MNRIKNSIEELEAVPGVADSDNISNDRVWISESQPSDIKAFGMCSELKHADQLAAQLPPIQTIGADWYEYDQGVWKQLDKARYLPQAQQVLPGKLRKAKEAKALLEHLEGRFQVPPEKLRGFHYMDEEGAVLINVANGVVKVTREKIDLLDHSPDYQFCRKMVAKYDPEAEAKVFRGVLSEALSDEKDRQLFQILTANLLMPDCRYEVAVVCYGEAGTSKSTVVIPMLAAFGQELVRSLGLNQICDPRSYHLPHLRFAAVNLASELDALPLGDSANFKAIVSGETLEVRAIYAKPFTMKTTAKLWFLANSLPRFKNGTDAEIRRIRFLRFANRPAVKDVTLKERLLAERDGALLFMLEGLKTLLPMRSIDYGSVQSEEVQNRFRISNDPLGVFVADHCVLDQGESVRKEKLRVAFQAFCETHELNLDSSTWFFRKLYERFPELKDSQKRSDGVKVRCIQGLKLKNEAELP